MSTNTQGSAENFMKDLGRRLDELMKDLDAYKEKAKVEYADEIEELKRNKETIKEEFTGFREKHKDRWEEVQTRLENAAEEIGKAIEATFKKRPAQSSDEPEKET